MKFPYCVTHNGITYMPNEEIPENNTKLDTPKKEETPTVEKQEVKITKTDVNRMTVDELKKLAKKCGVETANKSGAEIKKELIDKYRL